MPIYEYVCQKCDEKFEVLVSSSTAKSVCPQCGSAKIERQFSTFAAHGSPAGTPCGQRTCPSSGESSCSSGACPFA